MRIPDKSKSLETCAEILKDCAKRTGKPVRFLQTDGDGTFRSAAFKSLRDKLGFLHIMSAAYDHSQSGLIDRECRTMLETISTMLAHSGAPPYMWAEAAGHWTYTKNRLPVHKREVEGKQTFLSAEDILLGVHRPYTLTHLVGFVTQVTCYIPAPQREGQKTPGQAKCIKGVIVGYGEENRTYRVWDITARKLREISFNFSVVSEGFYPFKEKCNWPDDTTQLPSSFYPTFHTFLDEEEWRRYEFTPEQEKEIMTRHGVVQKPVPTIKNT